MTSDRFDGEKMSAIKQRGLNYSASTWFGASSTRAISVLRCALVICTIVHHFSPYAMPPTKNRESGRMQTPRLSVSLPRELYDEVGKIAKRDSRSLGWVVRKAVEELVKAELPLFNQR